MADETFPLTEADRRHLAEVERHHRAFRAWVFDTFRVPAHILEGGLGANESAARAAELMMRTGRVATCHPSRPVVSPSD